MRPVLLLALLAVPVLAAPVPKTLKKAPVGKPDGVWVLELFSSDGAAPALPQSMARDWVFEGEFVHVGVSVEPAHGAKGAPNFTVYDPDRPNLRKWGTMLAVYEVEDGGDTLRACYAHDGRKELSECKPDKGIHYYVFKRAK